MEIVPSSGTSRPAIDLNNVVLPQPEGPRKDRIPFSNSKLTSSKALVSLKSLVRFSTLIMDMRKKISTPFLTWGIQTLQQQPESSDGSRPGIPSECERSEKDFSR